MYFYTFWESILAKKVYRDCVIFINQKNTMADLVELDIVDFDVILGMDWFHFVPYREKVSFEGLYLPLSPS